MIRHLGRQLKRTAANNCGASDPSVHRQAITHGRVRACSPPRPLAAAPITSVSLSLASRLVRERIPGTDDLVLAGPNTLLLLDREEEPTGSCAIEVPSDVASDVALADLDSDGTPELIIGAAPGIVVLRLKLSL